MGFQIPKKEITLKFANDEYEGLEIRIRPGTIRDALRGEEMDKKAKSLSEVEGAQLLFKYLEEFITGWNVEDDGEPVPVSAESLLNFPAGFAWDIFAAFIDHTSGVSEDLGKDSASTKTPPVESIQMETL